MTTYTAFVIKNGIAFAIEFSLSLLDGGTPKQVFLLLYPHLEEDVVYVEENCYE